MTPLRYATAGESHGKCLITTVEGIPYGSPVDLAAINAELARRQGGYGRGARMKIERDEAEIVGGVRHERTLGSPLVLTIANRVRNAEELTGISKPRPGHADLAGAMKYGITDARDISERSSARETAARVAAGAWAASYLSGFGVRVVGYAIEIGGIGSRAGDDIDAIVRARDASPFYTPDPGSDSAIREKVDAAKREGDTLGGVVEVRVLGAPPGLGSYASNEAKLDGRLAQALMSVQTVKGVEVGAGFEGSRRPGSQFHDPIVAGPDGELRRGSNHAGGIEGGMTNGMPVVVRAACKPISTLRKPLKTVDLNSGEGVDAQYERSDVCVVPAASVIAQAVVAFEIARAFLEKFGADTHDETSRRYAEYRRQLDALAARRAAEQAGRA